jgi:hypothetical protein
MIIRINITLYFSQKGQKIYEIKKELNPYTIIFREGLVNQCDALPTKKLVIKIYTKVNILSIYQILI